MNITIKAKPFLGLAKVFFSELHAVSKGSRSSISVKELLSSIPILQYEKETHRQDLENRGPITRIHEEQLLVNEGDDFATEIGFIQSNFPPDGHDQLIKVRIPFELKAKYGGVGSDMFTLTFGTNDSELIVLRFPNNPDIDDQSLKKVSFNGEKCVIELEMITIVVDYTQDPDVALVPNTIPQFVKVGTLLNLQTRETLTVINGYYCIEKAFHTDQDCDDPEDRFCVSSKCNVEITYEKDEITVSDNETEEEAIKKAVDIKRSVVWDSSPFPPQEVNVTWTNRGGMDKTEVYARTGSCLPRTSVSGSTSCFVVTATFGQSEILDAYHAFRDKVLCKYTSGRLFIRIYYRIGPHLATLCRRSPMARTFSSAVLYIFYRHVLKPMLRK